MLIGESFLFQIIDLFQIELIVAVGNKAEESLLKLGVEHEKVRHPAQGGKNEFVQGIKRIKKEMKIG